MSLIPYVISVSVAVGITGTTVTFWRYYTPYFMIGGIGIATGAGLIFNIDVDTSTATRVVYECVLGAGVGLLMLANVMPCQTVVAMEHHSIAQSLAFFSSLLGA